MRGRPYRVLLAVSGGTLVIFGAMTIMTTGSRADDSDGDSRVKRGFEVAPVPLHLAGKNRGRVGLGSYFVNVTSGCNDCHTNPPYTRDPYTIGVGVKQVNTAGYLGGGQDFGIVVSRNLTPDKAGKPAGLTLSDFLFVMKTGTDLDHWHPSFPPPFDTLNGKLLQVMPWSILQDMVDDDLRAIYEYLSTIPCLEGDPGNPNGSDTHFRRCR